MLSNYRGFGLTPLYEEEVPPAFYDVRVDSTPVHDFLTDFTTPGPTKRAFTRFYKANLGVMLGVYLPTIQHILGVTMFIRLAWCVGVAGVGHTFLMLFLCCLYFPHLYQCVGGGNQRCRGGCSFFLILAIYFPAVTGILTGTNMSGDLANPQRSIPGGTIAAQLTTSFVYFSLALVFGASIRPELLRDKYGQSLRGGMVVASLAWPSAPRLLQSIAKDDVIPFLQPFAKVTKKNEPFYGLLLTTLIAELGILIGAMDSIAAVLDFFFLMCYAFVNIICALHSILGAPNWRPRYIYYHCTHWHYAILSILLCILIYKYVEWKGAKKEWGDGIRGLALSTAQYSLMQIPEKDPHPKNWRPQLLILQSMPWSKELVDLRYLNLLNFTSQLKAGKGLTMVVSFLRGNPSNENDMNYAQQVKKRMETDMGELGLRGFAKTLLYDEDQITGSVNTLIQSIGIGGLKPNTLLLSWPTKAVGEDEAADSEYRTFTDKLLAGAVSGMALLVAKGITEFPSNVKLSGYLDVYWIVRDGGLCVLITFLLKQSKVWRNCKIRIVAVARPQENSAKLKKQLHHYVYQLRIDAEILVTEINDPALSKTAFERTLLMEERTKMLKQMQRRGISSNHSQINGDANIRTSQSQNEENGLTQEEQTKTLEEDDALEGDTEMKVQNDEEGEATVGEIQTKGNSVPFADSAKQRIMRALDRRKVQKMHGAIRLNELILEHSSNSQLVLFSLPKPPFLEEEVDDYIQYLEVISDKLRKVLFVRGTGAEVITTSS
uniref:AA_permease domain-containing protein n=1 Tax=Globodera pallida TaxID=36090 RepID=A0A183BQ85_GLOPA